MKHSIIKAKTYKEAKNVYRILDNKIRLKILNILTEKDKLTVSDIAGELKIFHSVASMHLRILAKYHIVNTEVGQDSRKRMYSINKQKLIGYNNLADKILDYISE